MSKRPEAPSEKALHRRIVGSDALRGGLKGGVVGTALGAGLQHLGHGKGAPAVGAALGSALGAASGYHHGKERALRDTVTQERQHMKSEARTKKSYDEAVWAAFRDELTKQSAPVPGVASIGQGIGHVLGSLGRGVVGAGRMVGAQGATAGALRGMRAMGATGNTAYQALGGAALGAGALGAAALGRATAPRPGYY